MSDAPEQPGFAEVTFPLPLRKTFHYEIPAPLQSRIQPGCRVWVPFGPREAVGYCVGFTDDPGVDEDRVKPVLDLIDEEPLLDDGLMDLTKWLARYYLCSWGQALQAAVPGSVRDGTTRSTRTYVRLTAGAEEITSYLDDLPERFESRRALLERLRTDRENDVLLRDLIDEVGCSRSPLETLEKDGLLEIASKKEPFEDLYDRLPDPDPVPEKLTDAQNRALDEIRPAVRESYHETFLLHGVTGSGKTEVYLRSIREVIDAGRQAIVLLPEISLTPQALARFRDRFDRVAVMHSYLSDARRRSEWHRIRDGEADVVIGARSAVFAPTPDLGLIVVDEEHDTSYKQTTTPRYQGRDTAVYRGHQEGAPVLLGSATPSITSRHNAESGKYTLLPLPERIGERTLPDVQKIDMTLHHDRGEDRSVISEPLEVAIRKTLRDGHQAMLFLNRRGFASVIFCPSCRENVRCPNCDVSLTYHRSEKLLRCHHCEFDRSRPSRCENCENPSLIDLGMGTERIEKNIRQTFPNAEMLRMDSDTMTSLETYEKTVRRLQEGDVDLLVGTQMIAKGLHFPGVRLVGIISADTSLHLPNYRAAEATFQLITQIAGRAGRGTEPGKVVLQTHQPDHYSIRTAETYDYRHFWEQEVNLRKTMGYPPFKRLLRILLRGADQDQVETTAQALRKEITPDCHDLNIDILGPTTAPLSRLQNRYRYHLLLKLSDPADAQTLIDRNQKVFQSTSSVEIIPNMDPMNIL